MITLAVTTKNRSDFLCRLLSYYKDTGYTSALYISDGSDNPLHYERAKKFVASLRNDFSITYSHDPGSSVAMSLRKIAERIATPYVAFVGDDDFLVPSGLQHCVDFLQHNKDYSAAHGIGALCTLVSSGPYGKVQSVGIYPQPSIEGETATERLSAHLNSYTVSLFSVYRTETWRALWNTAEAIVDTAFGAELLPCCLSVVYGKIKALDCFYLVRQNHDRRYLLLQMYEWIAHPLWSSAYHAFRVSLARALASVDSITEEDAEHRIKLAFGAYLRKSFVRVAQKNQHVKEHYSFTKRLRRAIKPLIYTALPLLYAMRFHSPLSIDVSLPALLHSSSPYHKNFLPIYNAMTAHHNV